MPRIFYVIHGAIQGVGYRNLVRTVAKRNGIRGWVRNMGDGSVRALAIGDDASLRAFEEGINVSVRYGPQVFAIEKHAEGDAGFPKDDKEHTDFLIEREKHQD